MSDDEQLKLLATDGMLIKRPIVVTSDTVLMCDLFHRLALSAHAHFGFTYRQNEEDGSRKYLRMVKEELVNG